jgi:hypothetical protein
MNQTTHWRATNQQNPKKSKETIKRWRTRNKPHAKERNETIKPWRAIHQKYPKEIKRNDEAVEQQINQTQRKRTQNDGGMESSKSNKPKVMKRNDEALGEQPINRTLN